MSERYSGYDYSQDGEPDYTIEYEMGDDGVVDKVVYEEGDDE